MNALAVIIIILSSLSPISDYFLFYSISLMDNIFPLLVILFSILTIALKSKTVYSVFASVFALLFYMTNAGWNVFITFISFMLMILSFFMAVCAETNMVMDRKAEIWKIRKESELAREKSAASSDSEKIESVEKVQSVSVEEKKDTPSATPSIQTASKKRKEIIRWPRVLFIISSIAVACTYLYLIIVAFTFSGLVDWFDFAVNTGNIFASAFISAFLPVFLIALCFIRKRSVCVISSLLVFFLSAWAILQLHIYYVYFNYNAIFFSVVDVFSYVFFYPNSIFSSFNDYPIYYVNLLSPLLLVITSIIYARSKKVYVPENTVNTVATEKKEVEVSLNPVSSVSEVIGADEKEQDEEDEILDVEKDRSKETE
ncbi:MAG TPA: hypothetical protein IAB12_00880 [Candidatus Ornithospirochaeta avicola]|uniref:Uncharacterized protein n=1 Tax=Candidatus Ornithospirochaeta avicola TaxID=2840896 RepID=A0A9D1PT89_9SPIO|nr:hypothetical protein [Candidatus Ornithospirochaeta avicola]